MPFPNRRRLTWTTIVIKITRTASDATPANPEAGMARAAFLPVRGGADPPPIAIMIEVHPVPAGDIPAVLSAAALPRIDPPRPANMAATSAAALPRIAPPRPVRMAATSAAALPRIAQPRTANTADTSARQAHRADRAPAQAAAERPPEAESTALPARLPQAPAVPVAAGDTVPPAAPPVVRERKRKKGVIASAFNPERSSSSRF